MNVFPEKMNKISYDNLKVSVQQIEAYLRYMCERTEYAVNNITKVAAQSGNIGAEVIIKLNELDTIVSTIQSQTSEIKGNITNALKRIEEIEKRVSALEKPQ